MTQPEETQNVEQKQKTIYDLIQENQHPAIQIVLRGLQSIRSKLEDGADVTVRIGENPPFIIAETKNISLVIEHVTTGDGRELTRFTLRKTKQHIDIAELFLKSYMLPYDREIVSSLTLAVLSAIKDYYLFGSISFDEAIPRIIHYIKDLINKQ
jgi:hypothetical protein